MPVRNALLSTVSMPKAANPWIPPWHEWQHFLHGGVFWGRWRALRRLDGRGGYTYYEG